MATTTNPHRTTDERLTPRMAQDKQEREEAAARAMGWFVLALVAIAILGGAYYYATEGDRAIDGTYISEQTGAPLSGTTTGTEGTDRTAPAAGGAVTQ